MIDVCNRLSQSTAGVRDCPNAEKGLLQGQRRALARPSGEGTIALS